jgi:hypothetical protein
LDEDISDHFGQHISVEPLPQAVPAVSVEPLPQDSVANTGTTSAPGADPISGLSGAPSADAMPPVHVIPIPAHPAENSAGPESTDHGGPAGGVETGAPAEPASPLGGSGPGTASGADTGPGTAERGEKPATPPALPADDTSTAALKIVDAKSH